MQKNLIQNYEYMCQEVANQFATKYFGKEVDSWWVAGEVGRIYFINDYFFNMENMVDFLKYRFSKKKMFDYYEYSLEMQLKNEIPWNIKTYRYVK